MKPNMNLSPAEWRADLHFLATELPRRHANAFFLISRAAFDAEVAALDRRIETANPDIAFGRADSTRDVNVDFDEADVRNVDSWK
jgi:hypothetical protein